MQKLNLSLAALPLVALLALGCTAEVAPEGDLEGVGQAEQAAGNGMPKADKEFQMNIVGVPKGKSADMNGNDGKRIFISLDGKSDIYMGLDTDFAILDANGTDGSASMTCEEYVSSTGEIQYQVWARVLGKPGGSMSMTPCATDAATGETYCSTASYVATRQKGKSSFTNVTKDLLTVQVDLDGDGVVETYPMFDDAMQNYFWSYDNNGCKLVQLRFIKPVW